MNKQASLSVGIVCTFLVFLGAVVAPRSAHATFSIVAIDSTTGTIGGAGASCIAGSEIINDIIEGVGAVHTQAYYIEQNQDNAHTLLAAGITPDSIIHWLENNDVESSPEIRQYGVVTLAGPTKSAAYTGWGTSPWANHIIGPGYAIQGNILLSQQILDTMEFAFLNTPGPLEDRLMAAMEAANVPGADTRCLSCVKPAISAFIKVVRLGDGATPYLHKVVGNTDCPTNPIPLLRQQFDAWRLPQIADPALSQMTVSRFILRAGSSQTSVITVTPKNSSNGPLTYGGIVSLSNTGTGTLSPVVDIGDGTYTATITAGPTLGIDSITASMTAGGQTVQLNQRRAVTYFKCGDANGDQAVNIGDVVYILNCIFRGGPCPDLNIRGEVNCDNILNIADVVYLINHVFKSGFAPCSACP